jgi:hypothetical protein
MDSWRSDTMTTRDQLKELIRTGFGCSYGHPTDLELDKLVQNLSTKAAQGNLNQQDWHSEVSTCVESAGKSEKKSIDFSDLNALLDQAIQAQNKPGSR